MGVQETGATQDGVGRQAHAQRNVTLAHTAAGGIVHQGATGQNHRGIDVVVVQVQRGACLHRDCARTEGPGRAVVRCRFGGGACGNRETTREGVLAGHNELARPRLGQRMGAADQARQAQLRCSTRHIDCAGGPQGYRTGQAAGTGRGGQGAAIEGNGLGADGGALEVQRCAAGHHHATSGGAQAGGVANGQGARAHGGGTGVGVGARQGGGARTRLRQRAGAADHARMRHRIAAVEDQRAVVAHIACNGAAGATRAHLQGACADGGGPAVGVVARQGQGVGACLAHRARAANHA